MTTPRRVLVDPDQPLCYHLVSRCVRRGWLCGYDRVSKRNYSYRKQWLTQRLTQLAGAFAIDLYAYAILPNHFHLVVYYDPQAPQRWSDDEVIERWLTVCPPKRPDGTVDEERKAQQTQALQADAQRLEQARCNLGSLSLFMKLLKQPIARRANQEDDCTGHFFEQRFYSGALLSDAAVLAAMAYVDLNPVRAKIAQTIEDAKHTSIHARLTALGTGDACDVYLAPVVSGIDGTASPLRGGLRLSDYIDHLQALTPELPSRWAPAKLSRWRDQVATLKKRQRVFGPLALINAWIAQRGLQCRELPLP